MTTPPPIHGLMAEFTTPEELLEASRMALAEGYRCMDAYTPFPVEGLSDAVGFHRTRLPLIVLIGGVLGGLGAFFMQWFSAVHHYPVNIGGRPLNSWPSFIPITFELTILSASFAAVFGMLGLNGLPKPHHPVFNVPQFELATRSHFFLVIQREDPRFDREATARFLEGLHPRSVVEVPT